MCKDTIKGYRMTDIGFRFFIMYESDRAFQKAVDALNTIGCMSFMLTKAEIERIFKDGRCIKYDSLCN